MITYRIDVEDVHAHLFRVTLRVPQPAAQQRLSLPVWIPGSYLVREFARHLSDLRAEQGGKPVPLTQLDKASWQAECAGRGELLVSARVYAFDTSVRCAWVMPGCCPSCWARRWSGSSGRMPIPMCWPHCRPTRR